MQSTLAAAYLYFCIAKFIPLTIPAFTTGNYGQVLLFSPRAPHTIDSFAREYAPPRYADALYAVFSPLF